MSGENLHMFNKQIVFVSLLMGTGFYLAGCGNCPKPADPTEAEYAGMYPVDTTGTLIMTKEVNPDDVLINGSFDLPLPDDSVVPVGWESIYKNLHDETTTYSLGLGRLNQGKSLQLQGSWCHMVQVLRNDRLQPFLGKKARVSLWCRTTHPRQLPFMRLDMQVPGEPKARAYNIGLPSKDWSEAVAAPWTFFSSTVHVPPNTEWLRVDLANKGTTETVGQRVMFDDVTLEVVN